MKKASFYLVCCIGLSMYFCFIPLHIALSQEGDQKVKDENSVDVPTPSVDATVEGDEVAVSIVRAVPSTAEEQKLRLELKSLDETELKILLDLRRRSEALDKRTKLVQDRENVVASAQEYIKSRMEELKQLQTGVEAVLEEYKQEESLKFNSLVKIYENMKPQDAAQILENLDMNTLLEVIARMKEVKVAPVLAKMSIAKAREATEKFLKIGRGMMSYNNVCSCELLNVLPVPETSKQKPISRR